MTDRIASMTVPEPEPPTPKGPARLLRALGDVTRAVSSGPAKAGTADSRWAICRRCDFLRANNTCSKCGCYMPAKVTFKRVSCPDKRW